MYVNNLCLEFIFVFIHVTIIFSYICHFIFVNFVLNCIFSYNIIQYVKVIEFIFILS